MSDDREREFLDAVARRTGLSHRAITEAMREQRESDAASDPAAERCKATDDAWDALPPQEEIGEFTWDPTPEAAALRKLFGTSAFRLIDSTGDRELVGARRQCIARAYLFALVAHRSKPGPPGTALAEYRMRDRVGRPGSAERYAAFVALRDGLLEADICLGCGCHTPGRACQCENDE